MRYVRIRMFRPSHFPAFRGTFCFGLAESYCPFDVPQKRIFFITSEHRSKEGRMLILLAIEITLNILCDI